MSRLLKEVGADLLFAPDLGEMYPEGFSTSVSVGGISQHLEGASRPQFFNGVATVVSKLLLQAVPDRAYFGEKDFQQLQVVRRMVRDLNIPVAIVAVPTIREADGLAMSSRNRYLSPAQRKMASALPQVMHDTVTELRGGRSPRRSSPTPRAACTRPASTASTISSCATRRPCSRSRPRARPRACSSPPTWARRG